MSLLKLLSAGKSLDGSKPMPSPYRMKSANFLPKFGSKKNPFAQAPKAEPAKPGNKPAETGSLFESEPASPLAPFRKAPPAKEVKPAAAAMPEAPAAPETKSEPKPASAVPLAKEKKPRMLPGIIKKFNPLAYLPKRQPGARAARPKVAKTAVQGELSLERVRVLRNELNDSDIEFVTAKAANTGTAGTTLPAMRRPKLTTWGRLTSRMMGGVETQVQ
jgi:hypothetical protein